MKKLIFILVAICTLQVAPVLAQDGLYHHPPVNPENTPVSTFPLKEQSPMLALAEHPEELVCGEDIFSVGKYPTVTIIAPINSKVTIFKESGIQEDGKKSIKVSEWFTTNDVTTISSATYGSPFIRVRLCMVDSTGLRIYGVQ